jgi:hypothetical protein
LLPTDPYLPGQRAFVQTGAQVTKVAAKAGSFRQPQPGARGRSSNESDASPHHLSHLVFIRNDFWARRWVLAGSGGAWHQSLAKPTISLFN